MTDSIPSALLHSLGAQPLATSPPRLPAAALHYAVKWQWPVFPIKPRGKKPLTDHGFHDASTDPARIREWWTKWPEANIGVPTGHIIGLDVIDADGPDGVDQLHAILHSQCFDDCSATAWCPETGPLDLRAIVATPGGPRDNGTVIGPGRHAYVPADPTSRNGVKIGTTHLDVRAHGGYVLLPPSVNFHGQPYTWLTKPELPVRLQVVT